MATAKRGRRRRARRPFLQIGRGGKVDLGERGEVSGVEWGGGETEEARGGALSPPSVDAGEVVGGNPPL